MPNVSDAELIKELFETYKEMMFKIAMSILHNESDAEDAVQDAFLSIINNFEKILLIPCIEKEFYFVTIIENISINKLNKNKRHPWEDISKYSSMSSHG